jgi:Zn-dependent protease with chaperone function
VATEAVPTRAGDEDLVPALTRLLARALRALGEAGQPVRASQLAATGWSALRHEHPSDAERLNGLMHYLARLPVEANEMKETK